MWSFLPVRGKEAPSPVDQFLINVSIKLGQIYISADSLIPNKWLYFFVYILFGYHYLRLTNFSNFLSRYVFSEKVSFLHVQFKWVALSMNFFYLNFQIQWNHVFIQLGISWFFWNNIGKFLFFKVYKRKM